MIKKDRNHISVIAGGIIILSGLLTSGCNQRKDVIGEKDMIDLIADLKLAEAYSNNQLGGPHHAENREDLANGVLAQHNVTKAQFDSTLGWYGRNLDEYVELYEKVDKRIAEKRRELLKDSEKNQTHTDGDNLWPYGRNGIISSLGISDGWIMTINEPELNSGDRLEWSMHLKDIAQPLTGVLGVEYDDGTAEAITSHFTNRQHIELSLQTDTAKTVSRIYGSMRRKSQDSQPLFADSIMLQTLPYDSLEYSRFRSQKKYGYPVRITQEDRRYKAVADSLRRDSISKASKLKKDSLSTNKTPNAPELKKEPTRIDKPLRPGRSTTPPPVNTSDRAVVKEASAIRKVN